MTRFNKRLNRRLGNQTQNIFANLIYYYPSIKYEHWQMAYWLKIISKQSLVYYLTDVYDLQCASYYSLENSDYKSSSKK